MAMDCWPRNAIWSQDMDQIIPCWQTQASPDLKNRPISARQISKPNGLTLFKVAFPPLSKRLHTTNLMERYWDVIIVGGNALEHPSHPCTVSCRFYDQRKNCQTLGFSSAPGREARHRAGRKPKMFRRSFCQESIAPQAPFCTTAFWRLAHKDVDLHISQRVRLGME